MLRTDAREGGNFGSGDPPRAIFCKKHPAQSTNPIWRIRNPLLGDAGLDNITAMLPATTNLQLPRPTPTSFARGAAGYPAGGSRANTERILPAGSTMTKTGIAPRRP